MMLEPLKTRAAVGVAKAIYKRIYLSGRSPRVFQSDLAKEFVAEVMKELIAVLGAKFRHSSPYHPQTNTHVERYNKTLATNLSLLLERKDQKDWDEYLGEVEYAQLVGAQKVLAGFSPLFLRGGWDALDPIDSAMGTENSVAKKVEVAEWMDRIKRARQIAMQNQELAAARDAKRYNLKAKQLEVKEGDEVWVMFPNVGTGRSRKLAFRLHGPYKLVSWLGEKRRTARLAHVGDEKDVITAHVDRIVKKNVLPQKLVEDWKPLKFRNAEYAREEVEQVEGEEERQQREDELAEQVDRDLDPEVAQEVERKLVDQLKTIQTTDTLLKRSWIIVTTTKMGVESTRYDSRATGQIRIYGTWTNCYICWKRHQRWWQNTKKRERRRREQSSAEEKKGKESQGKVREEVGKGPTGKTCGNVTLDSRRTRKIGISGKSEKSELLTQQVTH